MAKKKSKPTGIILLYIIFMMAITAAIFYYSNKAAFVRYPEFGIYLPANYTVHGIDVSHHQQTINWGEVKAMQIKNIHIGFSFIKATEGINDCDAKFSSNWQQANEIGLTRGAYHFFNPSKSGLLQAKNFIKNVQLNPGDLPPVLDIEQINLVSKQDLQLRVAEWLTIIEKQYQTKPIIYTSAVFYSTYLADKFDDYPLWVAHYLVKNKPRINRSWTFWQHNEMGHVNGIQRFVDFNVFNGDSTAFSNLLLK